MYLYPSYLLTGILGGLLVRRVSVRNTRTLEQTQADFCADKILFSVE